MGYGMADSEPREAREVTAEERAKFAAEAEKAKAEAAKADAEARKLVAEAARVESDLSIALINQRKAERAEREELTGNRYFHLYHFMAAVSESSVKTCMEQLNIWRRLEPGCPIEIIFTSPGGSVIDGMVLYDYLQVLRRDGHEITTGALGMAASMAGILLQAGDVRWMGHEAWVLLHEGSFGAVGTVAQVEDTVEWVKKIQKRILDIFASRAKVSKSFIQGRWRRKDWWLGSDECLKYGFVDEIR